MKTRSIILHVLSDFKPHSCRDVIKMGVGDEAAWQALARCWQSGIILRSRNPVVEKEQLFHGRLGNAPHTRKYYMYLLPSEVQNGDGKKPDDVRVGDTEFVRYLPASERKKSKSTLVLDFLKEHSDQAWFSTELVNALKEKGVENYNIMPCIRRVERRGLVYVKGYGTENGSRPFWKGYILTWIDQNIPRDEAMKQAFARAEKALYEKGADIPIVERIQRVHDKVLESFNSKTLLSVPSLKSDLHLTDSEVDNAIRRALELFKDVREIRIFGTRYLHHKDMPADALKAAVTMKQNYVKIAYGRINRMGHNWEACAEWYIELVSPAAKFREQRHQKDGMDPRRITIALIKPVAHRQRAAELDRVWSVSTGVGKPLEYVLECKQGLVRKQDLDDFLQVLKWSHEFGVDNQEGARQLRSGVVLLFAGFTFNPRDKVPMRDGTTISLASYAERLNIQILKASAINEKLRERGISPKVSIQKICRYSKDEREVRGILARIWEKPEEAESVISETVQKNAPIFAHEEEMDRVTAESDAKDGETTFTSQQSDPSARAPSASTPDPSEEHHAA